jgi:site-specific DNA recombinase
MNKYERLNEERKMIDTRKRVAAYCRVSTDNEDQANSFESQQRYFKQYIERNPDWELYEIFADEGISGTNTKKRKEFNRMIACAKNGDFDLIITKEISRFARNTLDSIYYTRDLKKHGVGVIFMNDNINTLDGDAELRLAIMSSIAQEESRKTSERVKWGQKRQMEQGVVFGRSMLGYDVENGKMTINEEGAKIVRLIFQKFVNEGKGTHVIARELREEGIRPMRVKEWQNTVILRIIRNEKYCGDLVQKKTYTPDFLSHEKKYNRGQEEFVIIKDHHEPIISRELFEEANRILDERSLSQEGKAKHSNRYPFSGKIKCGCCGASYVARYKTRKDGSRYKAWRCNEAAKHGSPHIDKAGNQVGCTGASIRNEDATHIMFLVTKELKLKQTKIIKNLISIIQSIIAMDTTGTDVEKLKAQIQTIEDKRTKLIDIYMSGDITKEEFSAARSKCDTEIKELQSVIDSFDKQQSMIRQQQELVQEISDAINEIVGGVEYDDEFYKHILDKMVVNDKDNIDVYLNLLPIKWSYTVAKASKKALAPERNISGASVGTEELNHLEMIGAIVYQLTKDLTEDEIKEQGFGDYFVDHTTGIFPQAAAGFPYTAASMQVKGDPITDLHESMAAEQKARTTYDNILRFCDDYDVKDPIRFLRAREVVHYQRFGENLRLLTDKLNEKNFYAFNPSFDKKCFKNELKKKKKK